MSPNVKRTVRIGVSLALAAGLLALFLRGIDLAKVGEAIAKARGAWILAAIGLSLLVYIVRTWRWMLLLRRVGRPSFRQAFSATCIGFAATTLLPARAGEVVRPVALARSTGLPFAPLLASVALERLLDLVTVLALFTFFALGGWIPQTLGPDELRYFNIFRRSALIFGPAAVGALAVLAFLAARPALADRVFTPFLRLAPERLRLRLAGFVRSFLEGLSALRTPMDVLVIAGGSLLTWLCAALQVHATLIAFDIRLAFPVSFFVITWAVIGLAIPTPGGVGGYHSAIKYALVGYYAVESNHAAAFAVVSHAISFVPPTLLGLAFLAGGGLSLGKLAEDAAEPAAAPVDAT